MDKNQRQRDQRRRALLALAGVTAFSSLPNSWRRPMVESVVLPAHAQTSPGITASTGAVTTPPEPPESEGETQTPPADGVLRGLVATNATKKDEGGPVADAEIFMTSMDGLGDYTVKTNQDGMFSTSLPAGRYAVVIEADGYYTWSSFPDVMTVVSGEPLTENITLLPSS